ncbi:MAG: hypothetical protein Q7U96_01530 [Chloroflexota bacterium]|nr:hypothetical protein [Chloroflexota bacterium]
MFQPTSRDELEDFLAYVIAVLERLKIPYMVVGGFAAIAYGELRFTADVDIVVDMQYRHVDPFVAAFPIPDYYASREGILDSLARRYAFNVIQPSTGAKVDLVPLPTDPQNRAAFARRQHLVYDEYAGHSADFATAEDTIIAKLHAYQETGSEKHLRDARGILVTQGDRLNLENLQLLARATRAEEIWQTLLQTTQEETRD